MPVSGNIRPRMPVAMLLRKRALDQQGEEQVAPPAIVRVERAVRRCLQHGDVTGAKSCRGIVRAAQVLRRAATIPYVALAGMGFVEQFDEAFLPAQRARQGAQRTARE